MGALGASMDTWRLVLADRRHRSWFMVVVLRAWLGRLLVLGSGGERLAAAVALRDGAASLRDRSREARGLENLDDLTCNRNVLAVAVRYFSGALRYPQFGTQLRQ